MKNIFKDFIVIFNEKSIKAMIAVLIFFVIDFITGFSNAIKEKNISSNKLRSSCSKMLQYFSLMLVGLTCDYLFSLSWVTIAISIWLCSIEFTSINENCGKNGLNIPEEIKALFDRKDGEG